MIQADALKAKLAQYQRNASYASEFLNAGHLNLDNLQKLNQRAQEISRVAGSQINKSAAETYGHEIEQLVEEALNRINAQHRGGLSLVVRNTKPILATRMFRLVRERRFRSKTQWLVIRD